MKQNHFAAYDGEYDTSYSVRQLRTYLPKPGIKLTNNRHSYRPTYLNRFDIRADDSSGVPIKVSQPFSNRLFTGLCAKKAHG